MPQQYSQLKAFSAVTKAALRSIAKSPSAVVFTIAFPLVFILVFGFLGDGGGYNIKIGITQAADKANPIYFGLSQIEMIKIQAGKTDAELKEQLQKGNISALIDIQKTKAAPQYKVFMQVNAADQAKAAQLKSIMQKIVLSSDQIAAAREASLLSV
jgi:ABC-2 type transport system permease protein